MYKALLVLILCSYFNVVAQENIWSRISDNKGFILNEEVFESIINSQVANGASFVIQFPDDQGVLSSYQTTVTHTMHPRLAEKFSSIKTFSGVSENGGRVDFTYCEELGVYGIINNKNHKYKISPNSEGYYNFEIVEGESHEGLECETISEVRSSLSFGSITARNVNDSSLRIYDLALSVTGEYSTAFLDGSETSDSQRVTKVMTGVVNSVNRLNGIFEKDLGFRMQLVANNDQLIFLDSFTDPYTTGDSLNGQLQQELDSTIGNQNYDVGHLYHQEPRIYGNAGCIACVCTAGQKGSAFTVHSDPTSDEMNLIAAHEFGHQFGAYHTQSSAQCRSGFNSEVEPGSGSTIMSYAGICGPNVQLIPDDYFNYTSIRDIAVWTINNSNCAEIIDIQNSAPVVDAGNDKIIPIGTPFVLEGQATDVDNDVLTYCWEQNDNENLFSAETPSSTQTVGPIFRSFPPSTSSSRYFPDLEDVVQGNLSPTWEVIPTVGRDINLVLTVRDNNTQGGQVTSDALVITTTETAGPFEVTSQNTPETIWTVGTEVTVNWEVANTNQAPVNTNEVEILLSLDGGQTFENYLLTTANDGTETFLLPNVDATENARIMVKAVNNVFYALNASSFTIEKSEFILTAEESRLSRCNNSEAIFNLEYQTFLEFDEPVTLQVEGLPNTISTTFSDTSFQGTNLEGEPFTLTLGNLDSVIENEYSFRITAISARTNLEKEIALSISIYDQDFETIATISPIDQEDSVITSNLTFQWDQVDDVQNYTLEVALDEDFQNIVISEQLEENNFVTNDLQKDQFFYWRVGYTNDCGTSAFSDIKSFKTACTAPENVQVTSTTISSIGITWNNDQATNWQVEYGIQGFVIGEGTTINVTESQLLLEGLASATEYDIYVRSSCSLGGLSDSSIRTRVSTLVDYCGGDRFYDSGGLNGNYSNNERITTIIAPNNPELDRVKVTFDAFQLETSFDFLTIYDGSENDPVLGTFSGTSLQGRSFSSSSETGELTFVFTSDGSVTFSGWSASVLCEPKPNCFSPLDFSIIDVAGAEAVFEWLAQGAESQWELEYGFQGFQLGDGETLTVSTESATISNLQPVTNYEIYIKTVCNTEGFSEVLGPFNFTTRELCSGPENIEFENLNFTSVSVNWQDLGASSWEVEYGLQGFALGNGTIRSLDQSELIIENLESGTTYDFYLQTNCADGLTADIIGPLSFNTPANYCNGDRFYDPGGLDNNYQNNEESITVIAPENSEDRVRVQFITFSLESNFDFLAIYDGSNVSAPLIGRYSGTQLNGQSISANNEEGTLTFVFTSDGSVTRSGWEAAVVCEARPNCSAPFNEQVINIQNNSAFLTWESDDESSQWTVEYGEQGFGIGDGTALITQEEAIVLENLTAETTYDVYLKSNCDIGGFSSTVGPITFTTLISCNIPTGLEATSVTDESIDLQWVNSIDTTNGWELEYGTSGFPQGTGTIIVANTNSTTVEELEAQTFYDIYIRANCGSEDGFSRWVGPLAIQTSFDYCAVGKFYDSGGAFGDYSNSENTTTTISPSSPEERVRVVFNSFNLETCCDRLAIYDGDSSEGTLLGTFNQIPENTIFRSTDASGALTFVFTSDFSVTRSGWDADVFCESRPNCDPIANLNVLNVGISEAELIASLPENITAWEIEYGEEGFVNGQGIIQNFNSSTGILENLQANTTYQIFARAICAEGGFSDIIGPIQFTTIDRCATPTNFRNNLRSNASLGFEWSNSFVDNWEIEYGLSGFTLGNGVELISQENNVLIDGLLLDTAYDIYLRAVCSENDKSEYTQLLNVRTTPNFCDSGIFTDSGGLNSNYSVDENRVIVIEPFSENEVVRVTFEQFDIEPGFDFLSIYDSNNVEQGLIGRFTGNDILGSTFEATNDSGALTFVFESDEIITASGWNASVSCGMISNCSEPQNIQINNVQAVDAIVTWDDSAINSLWDVQYGEQGFSLGTGTQIQVDRREAQLINLIPLTSYDVYIRGNCGISEVPSRWIGPLRFSTICDEFPSTSNLIRNGSFECGSLAGGWVVESNIFDPTQICSQPFTVQQNSFDICTIVPDLFPTDGDFASFLSFDGEAGDVTTMSQSFTVPSQDLIIETATLSFDFSVNYDTTVGAGATLPRTLKTEFIIDGASIELDEQLFGVPNEINSISDRISIDVLALLRENQGATITLNFEATIPESYTGPSKAMIDDVVLNIATSEVPVVIEEEPEVILPPVVITDTSIGVSPNPNRGEFFVIAQEDISRIEVYSIGGVLVEVTTPSALDNKVTMINKASGLYILKIYRVSGSYKVIKMVVE